jgi:hypothetical protein
MSETATPPVEHPEAGQPANSGPVQLPDDHPLVKSLAAQKDEIKELKAKAARLAEIEDAQKTAEQKSAEREAAAEKRAADAEARASRREIALDFKLSKDDAALLDTVGDEDAMRALAKRLAVAAEDKRTPNNYVPTEGTALTPPDDDRLAFVRRLTGRE